MRSRHHSTSSRRRNAAHGDGYPSVIEPLEARRLLSNCPQFGGDLVFGPTSTFEVDLSGYVPCAEFDTITVAGTLTFDGTLRITLQDGFMPIAGDQFTIATYGARLGEFDDILSDPLAPSLAFQPIYGPSQLTLVVNAAPVVGILASHTARAGQTLSFQFTALDPSPLDQVAGFLYDVDWTADGTIDQSLAGGASLILDHAFTTAGSHVVAVSVTDIGGQTGTITHTVHTYRLEVTPDGHPLWEGSNGADRVAFIETSPQTIDVHLEQLGGISLAVEETLTIAGHVIANGHSGRDRLDASQLTTSSAELIGGRSADTLLGGNSSDVLRGDFDAATGDGAEGNDLIVGGPGNDTLYGDGADGGEGGADTLLGGPGSDLIWGDGGDGAEGRADSLLGQEGNDTLIGHTGHDWLDGGADHDVLIGGRDGTEGNDTLLGGPGDDVLSGGAGADWLDAGPGSNALLGGAGTDSLFGGSGPDLLIADRTLHDHDVPALLAIRNEWASTADYTVRVAHLNGTETGGANGDVLLIPGLSVFNDEAVDQLLGGPEQDWFLSHVAEDLTPDTADDEIHTDTSAS